MSSFRVNPSLLHLFLHSVHAFVSPSQFNIKIYALIRLSKPMGCVLEKHKNGPFYCLLVLNNCGYPSCSLSLAIQPCFSPHHQTRIQRTFERKEQTSGKNIRGKTWQCGALLRKEGENDLKASYKRHNYPDSRDPGVISSRPLLSINKDRQSQRGGPSKTHQNLVTACSRLHWI